MALQAGGGHKIMLCCGIVGIWSRRELGWWEHCATGRRRTQSNVMFWYCRYLGQERSGTLGTWRYRPEEDTK